MPMFMFAGDRDFAFELDGNSYYYDGDGYGVDLNGFCYDGISKAEFEAAQDKFNEKNGYPKGTEIYYGEPRKQKENHFYSMSCRNINGEVAKRARELLAPFDAINKAVTP